MLLHKEVCARADVGGGGINTQRSNSTLPYVLQCLQAFAVTATSEFLCQKSEAKIDWQKIDFGKKPADGVADVPLL